MKIDNPRRNGIMFLFKKVKCGDLIPTLFLLFILCFLPAAPVYAALAVSVAGGDWAIGDIGPEVTKETTIIVQNDGSQMENIYIKVASDNWSPGIGAGPDTFFLQHNGLGVWSEGVTNTGDGIVLGKNFSAGESQDIGLRFTAPAETTAVGEQTMTVTLTAKAWNCGEENVSFTYNGELVTYGVVESSTGACWLDRNLGASQVATAYNDEQAYGDLFQWGRAADGHQLRTSSEHDGDTDGFATTYEPNKGNSWDGKFITCNINPDTNNGDWLNPQEHSLWQGVDGINNPCPDGFRLPTKAEFQDELENWPAVVTIDIAFASPLKLVAAGYRYAYNGSLYSVGSKDYYWTSTNTVYTTRSSALELPGGDEKSPIQDTPRRAYGYSVRCIKE